MNCAILEFQFEAVCGLDFSLEVSLDSIVVPFGKDQLKFRGDCCIALGRILVVWVVGGLQLIVQVFEVNQWVLNGVWVLNGIQVEFCCN